MEQLDREPTAASALPSTVLVTEVLVSLNDAIVLSAQPLAGFSLGASPAAELWLSIGPFFSACLQTEI